MIPFKKWNSLQEARASDDVLYHATSEYVVIQILKSNSFKLVPDIATGADTGLGNSSKRKIWYLSTTRHKLGGYHKNNTWGVMLNLDGNRISHNNKIVAVDYWGASFAAVDRSKMEAEDRVLSAKPELKPATKFIRSIHVLPKQNWVSDDHEKQRLRDIMILAKKKGIPLFHYDSRENWLVQRNPMKLDINDLKKQDKSIRTPTNLGRKDKGIGGLMELLVAPKTTKKFSDMAKKWLDRMKYYAHDYETQMSADFHNAKTSDELTRLIQVMHKKKLYSQKDLQDYLKNKWT
jgi:hypothetical protein